MNELKMKHTQTLLSKGLFLFFGSLFFLSSNPLFASGESDVITTIILINREAELVDIDLDGEILKRYLAVPDYFSSGKSHKRSLRESLAKMRTYGAIEPIFLPGSSELPAHCLQSFLTSQDIVEEHIDSELLASGSNQMSSELFLTNPLPFENYHSRAQIAGIFQVEKIPFKKPRKRPFNETIRNISQFLDLAKQQNLGQRRLRVGDKWIT